MTHPALYFRPFGAGFTFWFDHHPEILLSGPAGTGKSVTCLQKLFWSACQHPGFRGLIVRQVRASLSETGLATFENLVIPSVPPYARIKAGASREHRLAYHFPNGSQINVGGLDRPDKIMSSDYDMIYVQEATELKIDGWEALSTRLGRGRTVTPYTQLMADCNPSGPTHWLKQRCDSGVCKMFHSKHEDNPSLFNRESKEWTQGGIDYIAKLDNLTGHRKARLRHGKWIQAEGVVYDGWDASLHVIDGPLPPASWERFLSIDFGYTNPFVCQWFAEDPDGRLYLYREIYKTKTLVEDHAKEIMSQMGVMWIERDKRWSWDRATERKPVAVICDHDAEDRKTFERHTGLPTLPAPKAVTAGIQSVSERLKPAGDGKPRLFIYRNARCHKADPTLVEAAKPTCTVEEMDGYIWKDGRAKDEPVKENDHGNDACRYLCNHRSQSRKRWDIL